jgi:tyrosyl-tRNA synthetase
MRIRIALALLIGSVLASPEIGAEEAHQSLEQIVTEMATTPARHAALAEHYRAKAEKARAAERRHDQMARAYTRGKQRSGPPASVHCKNLAKSYAAMAEQYDELARSHDAEAKKAQQQGGSHP